MPKYQVKITAVSARASLALGKTLHTVVGVGWLDSRRLGHYLLAVDGNEELVHLPCVLVAGIDRTTADHVARLLRQAGVTVSVEESTIQQPMLLYPKANQRYRWHELLGPRPLVDQPPSRKPRVLAETLRYALVGTVAGASFGGMWGAFQGGPGKALAWAASWAVAWAIVFGLIRAFRVYLGGNRIGFKGEGKAER